jgi:hypothetical protein
MSFAGCSTVPTVTGCSTLAEAVLSRPVEHPLIGNSGDEATDWQLLGVAYAGALNTANDRSQTGLSIIQACEARDAQITASQRSLNPFD